MCSVLKNVIADLYHRPHLTEIVEIKHVPWFKNGAIFFFVAEIKRLIGWYSCESDKNTEGSLELCLHQGGWILATSLRVVLVWVYTWDSLPINDIKRLWPIHILQTSNMQYAFGVKVYGEVLYLEFYSVFSEQFISNEILLCKRL